MNYWNNREARAITAKKHYYEMFEKETPSINKSIENSKVYSHLDRGILLFKSRETNTSRNELLDTVDVVQLTSTAAAFKHKSGKTAILNFASFKNPGGKFIEGSSAQEESLCHDSTLYNVLSSATFKDYYDWNKQNLNRSLYRDRAIYSPNIVFFDKKGNREEFDVITCAAPNYGAASKYSNVTKEENDLVLSARIDFILHIAAENNVDTLILGAFGCGVFKQDAETVAKLFFEAIARYDLPMKFIFAIPDDRNNQPFYRYMTQKWCL